MRQTSAQSVLDENSANTATSVSVANLENSILTETARKICGLLLRRRVRVQQNLLRSLMRLNDVPVAEEVTVDTLSLLFLKPRMQLPEVLFRSHMNRWVVRSRIHRLIFPLSCSWWLVGWSMPVCPTFGVEPRRRQVRGKASGCQHSARDTMVFIAGAATTHQYD